MADSRNTLLRVDAPEWATINRDESREQIEWAQARTVEELLEAGVALSRTAHQILGSVEKGPDSHAGPA